MLSAVTGVNTLPPDDWKCDGTGQSPNNFRADPHPRAYPKLIRDFVKSHRLVTLGLLATVSAHIGYSVWGRAAQPGEAHLALGIGVMAGYAGVLTGAVRAFILERRRGK